MRLLLTGDPVFSWNMRGMETSMFDQLYGLRNVFRHVMALYVYKLRLNNVANQVHSSTATVYRASCTNHVRMSFLNSIRLVSLEGTSTEERGRTSSNPDLTTGTKSSSYRDCLKNTCSPDRLLYHVWSPPLVVHFPSG